MTFRKALIFSLTYDQRFLGGAEIAIREITDRISSKEIEFHMITLRLNSRRPRVERVGNIVVHRVGFSKINPSVSELRSFPLHYNKYLFVLLGFYKAIRLNRKYRFDLVWSMMASYNSFAALFFKIFNPNIPFILSLQEGDPIEHIKSRLGIFYPIFKKIFKKADRVQAISQYLAEFAKNTGYSKEVLVIPNGVNIPLFSREIPSEELDNIKEKIGKKEDDIFIVTTSRLVNKNGLVYLIRSLLLLPKNIKLIIIGQGEDESSLRSEVTETDLTHRIKFLGYIEHKDIPPYLKVSDIFIRPSLSEGMGNSFIEAMAAGIPVIATPVGGIVDFLFDPDKNPNHEPTGVFVIPKDSQSIASQIKRLLESPALRQQIISSAKKMVESRYDWDIIAKEMKDKIFL